jgi:Domain of unknown function (DUF4157)
MSDRLNTTAKNRQNLDSTFKVSPFRSRGFGVQTKLAESTPVSKAQLWENYQQTKQLNQKGTNISALTTLPIQAKLTIGQPGDKYEQEADRVADRGMAMSAPAQVQREELEEEELQMKLLAGTISPLVQREELPEEEELQMKSEDNSIQHEELSAEEELQMKQSSPNTQIATDNLESQLGSSKGSRNPLSDDVRSFMEPRFGADFSHVKIHTDSQAVQMARDVGAQAFAYGSDVYFGAGKLPGNNELTAHELTHVVQQGVSIKRKHKPQALLISESQHTSSNVVQRQDRDPDEVAATAKEDASIEAKAKSVLKQPKILGVDVHQVIWRLIQSHQLDTNSQLSGVQYEKTKKGIEVKLSGEKASTQGSIIVGDDVLQRIANGQSAQIVKEIEAQIGKVNTTRGTIDYVFIMGADNPKTNNRFYENAKIFFKNEYPKAVMVEDVRDLEGINQQINKGGKPVANLYIVSHAHEDGTLQFSLNSGDKTPRNIDYSELKDANKADSLTKPKEDLIGFWTNVVIRGCNLGRSKEMLNEVQSAFGGKAHVMAPTHSQEYDNGKESMAGPFYEVPGKSTLTDDRAFELIKAKPEYAFITDWKAMRQTLRRIDESLLENVYEGEFPAKGKEMEYLKIKVGAPTAIKYKFEKSSVNGDKTIFTYAAKDRYKDGDLTIDNAETPPNEKEAIDRARERSGRPDASTYKVRNVRKGIKLEIFVDVQRTEWRLNHASIHKQGKNFNPSAGTQPWFGKTN